MQTINVRFLQKTVIKVSGATILALASLFIVFGSPQHAQAQAVFPNGTSFASSIDTYSLVGTNIVFTVSAPLEGCVSADGNSRSQGFKSIDGVTWSYYGGGHSTGCTGTTFAQMQTGGSLAVTTTGYYAHAVGNNTTGGDWFSPTNMFNVKYIIFHYDSGTSEVTGQGVLPTVDVPQLDYYSTHQTRFLAVDYNIASTSSSTFSLDFDLDYFIEMSEIDFSDSSRNLKAIRVQWVYDYEDSFSASFPVTAGQGTSTENIDMGYRGDFDDGHYDFTFGFSDLGFLSGFVFPRTLVYLSFDVQNGVVSNVVTSISNGLAARITNTEPTEQECSITNIGGCLVNAFQFVFYPSSQSLTLFTDTLNQLQYKIPFVYIYQSSDLLTGLYIGTAGTVPAITVTTGIGDLTLISESQLASIPYVDLLRSLIAAGLWLMLFTALYRKTLSIHDKQTV